MFLRKDIHIALSYNSDLALNANILTSITQGSLNCQLFLSAYVKYLVYPRDPKLDGRKKFCL